MNATGFEGGRVLQNALVGRGEQLGHPVVIGGTPGQTPPQWLPAVSMTPDGKGIICDDTQTGGLVELAYDPATETLGGITGVFDGKKIGFVALADAGNDISANDLSGLSGLQSFVPLTFYAVTVR